MSKTEIVNAYLIPDKGIIRIYDNLDILPNIVNILGKSAKINAILSCIEIPQTAYCILNTFNIKPSNELSRFIEAQTPLEIPPEEYWQSLLKNVTLRDFQVEFLQWLEARRQLAYPPRGSQQGALCSLFLGGGKSMVSLAVYQHFKNISFTNKLLIICRCNNKRSTWAYHLDKFTDLPYIVIEGTKDKRLTQLERFTQDIDVAIIHYEGVRLHETELVGVPELVIIDEAQAIANRNAKQSNVINKITEKAKYTLELSGGVAQNRIAIQLFHPLHIIDRKIWPSFYKWQNDWCMTEEIQVPLIVHGKRIIDRETHKPVLRKVSQITGVRDPDALAIAVAPYIYQKKKSEVADQLPPVTHQFIETGLYKKQLQLYEKIRNEVAIQIKGMSIDNSLVKLLRLYQVCATLSCLDLEDLSKKADEAVEIMLELPEEKALVFSQFVPMCHSIYDRLIKAGAKALLITGENPKSKEKRDELRQQFKEDASIQFLVVTSSLEGTGSSYEMCSYLYRMDRVHTALLNTQVEGRIHRLTSTKPVNIIDFVTANSIEAVQMEILQKKIDDINEVLLPASTYTQQDINNMLAIKPK